MLNGNELNAKFWRVDAEIARQKGRLICGSGIGNLSVMLARLL